MATANETIESGHALDVKPAKQPHDVLAEDIRQAVYLASAGIVTRERKLRVVLDRIAAVDFLIEDLAAWITEGKHRPYRQRD
jgi:hypothetical protein